MDDKTISYYAHEDIVNRLEVHNRRSFVLVVIIFLALVLTNGAWLVYECSFEDIVSEQSIDSDGNGDVTVNGVGDINYGSENSADN